MKSIFPLILFALLIVSILSNFLAFLGILPLPVTLPLLFIIIYITIHTIFPITIQKRPPAKIRKR